LHRIFALCDPRNMRPHTFWRKLACNERGTFESASWQRESGMTNCCTPSSTTNEPENKGEDFFRVYGALGAHTQTKTTSSHDDGTTAKRRRARCNSLTQLLLIC
jgi:hypothetical protein